MMRNRQGPIEHIHELPPLPADKFILWLEGFLTERKTLSEDEVKALNDRLKLYTSPRWIREERS